METDVTALRGAYVLQELRQLVLLSNQHALELSRMDEMALQQHPPPTQPEANRHDIMVVETRELEDDVNPASSPPMLVKFPRKRADTLKGGANSSNSRKKAIVHDQEVENIFLSPPKMPLGLARTVRRTLSGGLSNILRPFQPSLTKNHEIATEQGPATTPRLQVSGSAKGTKMLKKAVSTTFSGNHHHHPHRVEKEEASSRQHGRRTQSITPKFGSTRGRKAKNKARESICSRNSTISIMEYLAARKKMEGTPQEEKLVPLSAYGRDCHLYGCDSPHIWNPDKNSSCAIIHCDCDEDERSNLHEHIDERAFFYQPGESVSTCVGNPNASYVSSLAEDYSEIEIPTRRPSNPAPSSESIPSLDLKT